MNKKSVIFFILISLSVISFSIYQYSKEFQAEFVKAYTSSKPANGHTWSEMECSQGLCITSGNKVGIGIDNPTEKLQVSGNIKASGVIESTSGGFKFPDGTIQTTRVVAGATGLQGPAGPTGATGATGATGPAGPVQSGMIAMFTTACPSGWTRFTGLDDRVPRGGTTYGGAGGSETHSHSWNGLTGGGCCAGLNPGGQISSTSSWPPYLVVVWCQKN